MIEQLGNGVYSYSISNGVAYDLKFKHILPKIPRELFLEIVERFKEDLSREDMCIICFDKKREEYFLSFPYMRTSKTRVSYLISNTILDNPDIVQVMQVHSHNTMRAIFSTVDDRDEINPMLYAVVGCLHMERPEVSIRAGYGGAFEYVDPKNIFE